LFFCEQRSHTHHHGRSQRGLDPSGPQQEPSPDDRQQAQARGQLQAGHHEVRTTMKHSTVVEKGVGLKRVLFW